MKETTFCARKRGVEREIESERQGVQFLFSNQLVLSCGPQMRIEAFDKAE